VVSSLNVGGAERFVIDLACEQKNALNCDVSILSMGIEGEPLEQEIRSFAIGLFRQSSIFKIRQLLHNFDIVHIHSSHCLLRVLLASINKKIKIIYTRHNEVVHRGTKWRMVYSLANLMLHKMVFVAEKAKQNYLTLYPEYRNKAQTILNGVLPLNVDRVKIAGKISLGHVGRFVPLKSQHLLIQAIAILPSKLRKNISLVFYGTGELLAENKALAASTIPDVEVKFAGFETNRNIIYQSFDALVVTSETEGLSLAILEAFASAKPVIASNVGGNPELVKHAKNGFLYEYGAISQLAECIEKLVFDEGDYDRLSKDALRTYENGFSMETCAAHHLQAYQ
jgi:glycosyltransferase involved in cell wall biosynthesis